jgi:2-hydroxy-3-keto-5-methylthiopentenyl-1-phosphate phosphatase
VADAVFVDYDGTITDADTFDVLVRHFAGDAVWLDIEERLQRGEILLREALEEEAALVTVGFDEAWQILERSIAFDPTFGDFVADCERRDVALTVVSSGVEPVIRRALELHGLGRVALVANALEADPSGWRIRFRDALANGTDKAALVRAARARGEFATYIGDGLSDFDAALVADYAYAKRGRRLEKFLERERVPFTPFSRFEELVGAPLSLVAP